MTLEPGSLSSDSATPLLAALCLIHGKNNELIHVKMSLKWHMVSSDNFRYDYFKGVF